MGITRVQGVQVNSSASVTTQAITCSAVTLGNLLIVAMATGNNATTLTGPARWTQATINQPAGASATIETAIFYLVVGASDAGATSFTFTLGSSHTAYICLEEWNASTGWPASPLDVVAQGDTIATPVTATTIVSGTTATTAQAEELWVAALAYKGSAQAESSVTSGWTSDVEATLAANNTLTLLYKVASSTGTASCSYVIGSAQFWAGSVATFKDTAGVSLSLTDHGVGTLAATANYKTRLTLTAHGVGTLAGTVTYKTALSLLAHGVGTLNAHFGYALALTAHGVGTLTGTASYKWAISKTFVGVGTLTATLKRTQPLTGTIHGVGTLTGTMTIGVHLSITSHGVGTLTGTLVYRAPLSVTIHGVGTLTATSNVGLTVTFTGRGRLLLVMRIPSALTYTVQISGVPIFIIAGTLNFTMSVGRRGTASFTVYANTSVHFQQYQPVAIYDNTNTLVFTGYVTIPKEQKFGYQASVQTTITCIDQHWLADKRCVAASYTNQSCGSIVTNIYNNILTQEGVTIGQIYDGLLPATTLFPSTTLYPGGNVSNIPQATFVYDTIANAFDALATAASSSGVLYYWMIDLNKQLWFVPYTTLTGPSIDGTTLEMKNNPTTVQRGNPLYRNTQYVLGGLALTPTQVETRIGDGATQSWTMGYPLASNPIIVVGGVTQTQTVKGAPSGAASYYWAQGDPVITQDQSLTPIASPTTIVVTYIGQYPSIISSANSAQIAYQASIDGTSGIVETVQIDNTLTSISNGLVEASQLLTRYAQQGVIAIMTTKQSGFAPGQLITVNLPMHGLYNTQMLVESVLASDQTDFLNIWYTITAIAGPADTTWTNFFSKTLKQIAPPNSINIGTTSTVQLLANFTASYTLTMSFTAIAYSCPLPSTTLFPSTTLKPC